METVATGNKKTTDYSARCAVTGLYLSDADQHFDVICITPHKKRALVITDMEAAQKACAFLRSLYGSFDWQPAQL